MATYTLFSGRDRTAVRGMKEPALAPLGVVIFTFFSGRDRMTVRGMKEPALVPPTMGHLHIIQWARQNDCPWNKDTCEDAVFNGHLHILQWARQNGCRWNKYTCIDVAVRSGEDNAEILQWIQSEPE